MAPCNGLWLEVSGVELEAEGAASKVLLRFKGELSEDGVKYTCPLAANVLDENASKAYATLQKAIDEGKWVLARVSAFTAPQGEEPGTMHCTAVRIRPRDTSSR